MNNKFIVFLIIFSLYSKINGIDTWTGTGSVKFLKLNVGARPSALSGAYISIADDINSVYYNPAGLVYVYLQEISITHIEWLAGTKIENVSYVYPSDYGLFAGSVLFFYTGDIKGTNIYGEETNRFSAYDLSGKLSYANDLTRVVKYGINLNLFREFLENESAFGLTFDFGLLAYFENNFRLGLCMKNFGSDIRFVKVNEKIPSEIVLGAGYELDSRRILFSFCAGKPFLDMIYFASGVEYRLFENFTLRAGYSTRSLLQKAFSGGFGLEISKYKIDLALVPYGDAGNIINLTVGKKF